MTRECGKPAEVVYVWPTMKTLPLCAEHAEKARGVAAALGVTLGQMHAAVGVTCTQKVEPPRGVSPEWDRIIDARGSA